MCLKHAVIKKMKIGSDGDGSCKNNILLYDYAVWVCPTSNNNNFPTT